MRGRSYRRSVHPVRDVGSPPGHPVRGSTRSASTVGPPRRACSLRPTRRSCEEATTRTRRTRRDQIPVPGGGGSGPRVSCVMRCRRRYSSAPITTSTTAVSTIHATRLTLVVVSGRRARGDRNHHVGIRTATRAAPSRFGSRRTDREVAHGVRGERHRPAPPRPRHARSRLDLEPTDEHLPIANLAEPAEIARTKHEHVAHDVRPADSFHFFPRDDGRIGAIGAADEASGRTVRAVQNGSARGFGTTPWRRARQARRCAYALIATRRARPRTDVRTTRVTSTRASPQI